LLSAIGFTGGHWAASALGWNFMSVGPLQLGPAICGSVIFLLAGNWLGQIRIEETPPTDGL